MLYLANPTRDAVQHMLSGVLGFIDTPGQGNIRPRGVTWCADNGCFGKGYPGAVGYAQWLEKHSKDAASCLFATAPDVVGDAVATLTRSLPFMPLIRSLGYPAALCAQNGLENLTVPWDKFDVLFLGGSPECLACDYVQPFGAPLMKCCAGGRMEKHCPSCLERLTEWKLGRAAALLTQEAKRRGKPVHMGRVNSRRRLRYAASIGCDTADGTYLLFGPRGVNLPKLLSWVAEPMPDRLEIAA